MKKEDKEKRTLTLADIVCKWYIGAAVGFSVGNLNGNSATACIGFVVGATVSLIFKKCFGK